MDSGIGKDKQSKRRGDGISDETREKFEMIRVKFLRLAYKLGQNLNNAVVTQILYRLWLGEQLTVNSNSSPSEALSFDRESEIAAEQEAAEQEGGLDFMCTILLLGKTGVGKSATINSIFGEAKCSTDAFQLGTKKVQEIVGTVNGIKIRIIDTPGLLTSFTGQHHNKKVLRSVKHFIKKRPPDIVLYLDRLDMQGGESQDLSLLNSITETFSAAVWFNVVVVLTHAQSAPPDGPNETPLSYELFVAHRLDVVRQYIRKAAGNRELKNPVSLVENHLTNGRIEEENFMHLENHKSNSRRNEPIWKPELLLLCFSPKILGEATALLKSKDNPAGKALRMPPSPYFLSSLLESRNKLEIPDRSLGYRDFDVSDMPLSFDGDNPIHRYQYRYYGEMTYLWNLTPNFYAPSWDHDIGISGLHVEKMSVIGSNSNIPVPVLVSGNIRKEKNISDLQMECATSVNLGEDKSTFAALDVQTVGRNLSYTLRSETRFFEHYDEMTGWNTAGLAITLLDNALIAGVKLEDKFILEDSFKLVLNGGAIAGGGNVASGGTIEATIDPLASTLVLSTMYRHGKLDIGCNLHSEFPLGQGTMIAARANINDRGRGQVSISTSSSKYFQLVLIGVITILRALRNRWTGSSSKSFVFPEY